MQTISKFHKDFGDAKEERTIFMKVISSFYMKGGKGQVRRPVHRSLGEGGKQESGT
jgi:hypothetical protein